MDFLAGLIIGGAVGFVLTVIMVVSRNGGSKK